LVVLSTLAKLIFLVKREKGGNLKEIGNLKKKRKLKEKGKHKEKNDCLS
jgi:hypothetical protein